MTERNKGRLFMVGAALCWGLAGVCVKSVTWGTMSLMSARCLITVLILFAVRRSCRVRLTKKNLVGGAMMTITGLLYMQAIRMTTAGSAIVLQYICPILILLYEIFFRHRKAKPLEILITLAVFGGCVLSFADDMDPTHVAGNLVAILSGVTFAAQIIIMHDGDCSQEDSILVGCILAVLVCTPFMFTDPGLSWDGKNVLWVLILGVFQYAMANLCFSRGIERVDSVEGSLILTLEPVFNPIPVAILCGEMMGPKAIAGFVLIIVFVTLYGLLPTLEARRGAKKTASPDGEQQTE